MFKSQVFVETGTLGGTTSFVAAPLFKAVHTVELSKYHYQRVTEKNTFSNLKTYLGNSSDVLKRIVPTISQSKLYWLDAHFSGGNTATLRDDRGVAISPLMDEIQVILSNGLKDSVILIDDICGYQYNKNDEFGKPNSKFAKMMTQFDELGLSYYIVGDLFLVYNPTFHKPSISQMVKYCTKSRLFNPYDNTKTDVIEMLRAEKNIATSGSKVERDRLVHISNKCSWYDYRFWKGIIDLQDKKYSEAVKDFEYAIERGFAHWRAKYYLAYAYLKAGNKAKSEQILKTIRSEIEPYQETLKSLYP